MLVVGAVVALLASTAPISANAAPSTTTGSAFTASKLVTRIDYDNGQNVTVDSRTVKVTVSTTKDLRERQGIEVSWSGAHPTGGLVTDPNSHFRC